jgi:hypothetical protein
VRDLDHSALGESVAERSETLDDDPDETDGGWRLRARQELAVDEIAEWLPPDVLPWRDRMTQRCLDELEFGELAPNSRTQPRCGAASRRAWPACAQRATEPPLPRGPRRAAFTPRFALARGAVVGSHPTDARLVHSPDKICYTSHQGKNKEPPFGRFL